MPERPLTWNESGQLVERTDSLAERQAGAAAQEFTRSNPAPLAVERGPSKGVRRWPNRPFPRLALEDRPLTLAKLLVFLFFQLPLLLVSGIVVAYMKVAEFFSFGP